MRGCGGGGGLITLAVHNSMIHGERRVDGFRVASNIVKVGAPFVKRVSV